MRFENLRALYCISPNVQVGYSVSTATLAAYQQIQHLNTTV